MPSSISLSDVVAAMQFTEPPIVAGVDTGTGRIVTSNGRSSSTASPAFRPIPIFTEQREIALARQYVATVANPDDRRRLQTALASESSPEAFETALFRCQIAHDWFQYRDQCLLQLAKEWLDSHGISYTDDLSGAAD